MGEDQIGIWPDKPPGKRQLLELIRGLIDSRAPVGLSEQADEFLAQADLDMSDVRRAFKNGDIAGLIEPGADENEWVCTVLAPITRFPNRKKEIGIVVVTINAASLLVGRVRWAGET